MVEYNQQQYTDNVNFDEVGMEPPGQKKNNRIWMGCCGGCLGIIVLVIIGFLVGTYFLFRAAPVRPHEMFILPDADAFFVFQVDAEDEGLVSLLTSLAQDPPSGIDMSAEEQETLREGADEIPESFAKWTPIHLVSLLYHLPEPEPVEPENLDLVHIDEGLSDTIESLLARRGEKRRFHKGLVGSMSRAGAMMRLVTRLATGELEKKGGTIEDYAETRIAGSPGGGFAISAKENNFFLANRTGIIHSWIDIIKDLEEEKSVPYRGPDHMKDVYEHIDTTSLIYFVFSNREGELKSAKESILEVLGSGDGTFDNLMPSRGEIDLIDSLSGSFHISEPQKAELEIFARSKQGKDIKRIGDMIEKTLQNWHDILLGNDITQNDLENIEIKRETQGDIVHISFKYHNFEDIVRQIIK